MQFTALQISTLVAGTIEGNPGVSVQQVAKIEEAKVGDLSFIANPKYLPYAHTTQASILIVGQDTHFPHPVAATLIRVPDPYGAFTQLLEAYNQMTQPQAVIEQPVSIADSAKIGTETYIGSFSYIGKNATIGHRCKIYPQCYIGNDVVIGNDTIIYPGVKIYAGSQLGANCIIHAGAIIGSDGFGFAPQKDGSYKKIPQIGVVKIADHVEIGANTTIDCATMGHTTIAEGVKLDNLIQVGHNVEIGAHTVIAAQSGISGSTKLGKHCLIGGQVGFIGHLKIADQTKVNAKSGLAKSVQQPKQSFDGIPAATYRDSMRSKVVYRRLPELENRLKALEKLVEQLTN